MILTLLFFGFLTLLYGGVAMAFFVGLTIGLADLPMSYAPAQRWPGWLFVLLILGGTLLWPLTLFGLAGWAAIDWAKAKLTPPVGL